MTGIGASRRYECSLTSRELSDAENHILSSCINGSKREDFDIRYQGIIEDNLVRGYLRIGIPYDSLRTRTGTTLRTTIEGRKQCNRGVKE